MASCSMDAARSVWFSNPLVVRWTPLPPLLEDSPSFTIRSVQGHDTGMQHAMEVVFGGVSGTLEQKATAHQIMSLPVRFGGFGISLCRANEARGILGFLGFPTLTDQSGERFGHGNRRHTVPVGPTPSTEAVRGQTRVASIENGRAPTSWPLPNVASGNMVGSITHRPLSSTTFGRT